MVLLSVLTAFLLWRGLDFYRQDLVARTDHPDYGTLRPAGLLGHGYGIVGTALTRRTSSTSFAGGSRRSFRHGSAR